MMMMMMMMMYKLYYRLGCDSELVCTLCCSLAKRIASPLDVRDFIVRMFSTKTAADDR